MQSIFTVTPMTQRFELEAGKSYTGSITVALPLSATKDFTYVANITPYSVSYSPNSDEQIADLGTNNGHTLITDWITITNPTGTISPNGYGKVNFVIDVPENAPAGGQYATIAISPAANSAQEQGFNINTILELASIIYVNVDGETIHSGEILENNVPIFSTNPSVTVSSLLSNNGNTHEDATYKLTIKNNFTGEDIYPATDDQEYRTELIMPETTRYISREIKDLPIVGIVHVNQSIYYNGGVSIVEKDVFICPIWLMAIVLAIICGAVTYFVIRAKSKRKKRTLLENI